MSEEISIPIQNQIDSSNEVSYNTEKDFYRGSRGELRLKAEGLFKKAKEKGISIEDVSIVTLKENRVEFPGLGFVELPTYIAKVRGKDINTGQVVIDGKQIDYFNRYHKYLADYIEDKNVSRDFDGRIIKRAGRIAFNEEVQLSVTEWELFQIGKSLIEDKEFGLEKTITGACDRVIRKLMGENDWLYPNEAKMLDEEFKAVQEKIKPKLASERQISFLKARIKNAGLDPENEATLSSLLAILGHGDKSADKLTTTEMSKVIDGIISAVTKFKESTQNPQ